MTQPLRMAVAAMGTRFELALLDGHADLKAAGEAAIEEIVTWHDRLSRFAPDSLISYINREAARTPVRLDRDTFELLSDALDVWRASEGAFDITIAPAMTRGGHPDSAVPTNGGRGDSGAVVLDAERWTVAFARPHVSIDLGGIGKGHALDCATRVLRAAGVTTGLLHGGTSSVVASGAPDGSNGWRVAVPFEDTCRTVTLRDSALSLSDTAGPRDARRPIPHILDPRGRTTVAGPGRAVVVGPSARLADAWSTALVVLRHTPGAFPPQFSAWIDVREEAFP